MRSRVRAIFVVVSAATALPAAAQEHSIFGPRSLGMGGTGAAIAHNGTAVYGNPAALAFMKKTDFQFPLANVAVDLEGDIIAEADEIDEILGDQSIDELVDRLEMGTAPPSEIDAARRLLLDLFLYEVPDLDEPGQGATFRVSAGPIYRFRNWAVGLSGFAWAGIDPVFDASSGLALATNGFTSAIPGPADSCPPGDTFCTDLAADLVARTATSMFPLDPARAEQLVIDSDLAGLKQDARARQLLRDIVDATAAGEQALDGNRSGVGARGLVLTQAAFGWGLQVIPDRLAVGATAKFIRGQTYRTFDDLSALEDGEDVFEDFDDRRNRKSSTKLDLDLGLMFRPTKNLALGLVGQNLTSPAFAFSGGRGSFELESRYRAGVAWSPRKWLGLAADLDLNEVDSQVLEGLSYRHASVGAEFVLGKVVALRAGAYQNLSPEDADPVLTGGIGFRIHRFEIALAGAVSGDEQRIEAEDPFGDDETFPSGAGVSISLGWNSTF